MPPPLRPALLALALAGLAARGAAQEVSPAAFAAWAARNDYVPGTDWRSYLLIAPGNMGPNALPVFPTVRGRVDTAARASLAATHHRAPGDRATDLTAEVRWPFGRRASLRVRYTALEWYRYDESVALARNTVRPAGSGVAQGDVYVEGIFQLVRERRRWPDLALAARIKTAASSDVEAMRYTDTPGYAFDVSGGKDIALRRGRGVLRPFASAGFFVWQRFGEGNPQNDAFTYAAGAQWGRGRWEVVAQVAGYAGYTGELDQPLVTRASIGWRLPASRWRFDVGAEFGVRDYAYDAATARLVFGG